VSQALSSTEDLSVVRHRLQSIFGGSIGTQIEWYDLYVFNFFAPCFAKSLFPNASPTALPSAEISRYRRTYSLRPIAKVCFAADRAG